MSDVTYYKYMKYVDVENLYNVDSRRISYVLQRIITVNLGFHV